MFELAFNKPYVSYRALRFPWIGVPDTVPDLAFTMDISGLKLGYSWNGATEVASWVLYGGDTLLSLRVLDQKTKTGFETQSHLSNPPSGMCYFQVAALDKNGKELSRSEVISTNTNNCPLGD